MKKILSIILLILLLVISVSAQNIEGLQNGDYFQITIKEMSINNNNTIDIYVNGEMLASQYPSNKYTFPLNNQDYLNVVVINRENNITLSENFFPDISVFSFKIWFLIGLIILFAVLSLQFITTSWISFVISAYLLFHVIPNTQYVPALKIFTGLLFVFALSTVMYNLNRNFVG